MTIQEAIKARTAEKPYIAREKWRSEWTGELVPYSRIEPTDSPSHCLTFPERGPSLMKPYRNWIPSLEDVMANDWFPTS